MGGRRDRETRGRTRDCGNHWLRPGRQYGCQGDEAVQIDVYTKFLLDFAHAIQRFFVRFQVPGGRHVKKVGETQLERGAELDEDARSAAELGDEPTVEGLVPEPLGMDGGAVRLTDLNVVGVKRLDDFHVVSFWSSDFAMAWLWLENRSFYLTVIYVISGANK